MAIPFDGSILVFLTILAIVALGVFIAARDYSKCRQSYGLGTLNVHNFADAGERMANVVMMSVAVATMVALTWKMSINEPEVKSDTMVAQNLQ